MEIALLSVICLASLLYIFSPFFRKNSSYYELEVENDQQIAYSKIEDTLKELDFDLEMEKISESDYNELREKYISEKQLLEKSLKKNGKNTAKLSLEERLEREIELRRKGKK